MSTTWLLLLLCVQNRTSCNAHVNKQSNQSSNRRFDTVTLRFFFRFSVSVCSQCKFTIRGKCLLKRRRRLCNQKGYICTRIIIIVCQWPYRLESFAVGLCVYDYYYIVIILYGSHHIIHAHNAMAHSTIEIYYG